MDYFNYPLFNPILLALALCPTGRHGLELISFLFYLPLAALIFLIIVAFTKNPTAMGTALPRLPYWNWIWCLGFLPDWGKDHKLSMLRVMCPQAQ